MRAEGAQYIDPEVRVDPKRFDDLHSLIIEQSGAFVQLNRVQSQRQCKNPPDSGDGMVHEHAHGRHKRGIASIIGRPGRVMQRGLLG